MDTDYCVERVCATSGRCSEMPQLNRQGSRSAQKLGSVKRWHYQMYDSVKCLCNENLIQYVHLTLSGPVFCPEPLHGPPCSPRRGPCSFPKGTNWVRTGHFRWGGEQGLLNYRGHKNVADCFHSIPLRHTTGQRNLEHGMALQDLLDAVEYHPELPVTQEPWLHL